MVLGVGIAMHGDRVVGGREGRLECMRQVVGRKPVVRQRRIPAAAGPHRLDRHGKPGVQAVAFAGQQVAVDRLAHERVPEDEVVATIVDRNHDLVVDRIAKAPVRVDDVDVHHGRHHRAREPAARGRRDAQEFVRIASEPCHPRLDGVQERLWQHRVGSAERDELFREERIPVRSLVDAVDQPWIRRRAGDPRDLFGDLGAIKSFEVEPAAIGQPLDLGEE